LDDLVKSLKMPFSVIPAKAGIQLFQDVLDPGFRRGDASRDFLRVHQIGWLRKKSIFGVALQLRRCSAPVGAPHSSVFARVASGAFYAAIGLLNFYEIIKLEMIPFFCEDPGAGSSAGSKRRKQRLTFGRRIPTIIMVRGFPFREDRIQV
jgi:hypothetical protein